MLGHIHGYGLSGAGSNLWTRSVMRACCEDGATIHLVCQERKPEDYDFIAAAYGYDAEGRPSTLFTRDVPYPGRCIFHRPQLNVLPTYVRPTNPSDYVFSILDLDDDAIDEYLARNARVMRHVAEVHGVEAWHVNHLVLLAVAALRLKEEDGVPFGVMSHGSEIEYIIKEEARSRRWARAVLEGCDRVFALNREIRTRLADVFPDLDGLEEKTVTLRVGVDTRQFRLVTREERAASIGRMASAVAAQQGGRTRAQQDALAEALADDLELDTIQSVIGGGGYRRAAPDADLVEKLNTVDWANDAILLYVGRLLAAKGLMIALAALPSILARHPSARLVVVGEGALREGAEAFVGALAQGHRRLARNLLGWGAALEGQDAAPFAAALAYFDRLDAEGRLGAYFEVARALPEHVLFTGYLEHEALCHLFPCCDVGVFPSVVKEASPLVVPEAAACGVFPIGTYTAGMRDSLDAMAPAVPEAARAWMRLRPDPAHTVADLVEGASAVLAAGLRPAETLRRVAVEQFDWHEIAATMRDELTAMAG